MRPIPVITGVLVAVAITANGAVDLWAQTATDRMDVTLPGMEGQACCVQQGQPCAAGYSEMECLFDAGGFLWSGSTDECNAACLLTPAFPPVPPVGEPLPIGEPPPGGGVMGGGAVGGTGSGGAIGVVILPGPTPGPTPGTGTNGTFGLFGGGWIGIFGGGLFSGGIGTPGGIGTQGTPGGQIQGGIGTQGTPGGQIQGGIGTPSGGTTGSLPQCSDNSDNDGDTLVDLFDPGCSNSQDNDETHTGQIGGTGTPTGGGVGGPLPQCGDGADNDGDSAVDYPNDFGCSGTNDADENMPKAQCQDGSDNDGDGKIDMNDSGCSGNQDNDEAGGGAGGTSASSTTSSTTSTGGTGGTGGTGTPTTGGGIGGGSSTTSVTSTSTSSTSTSSSSRSGTPLPEPIIGRSTSSSSSSVERDKIVVQCCRGNGWFETKLVECLSRENPGAAVPQDFDTSTLACGAREVVAGDCARCGAGLFNFFCDEDECDDLAGEAGLCNFIEQGSMCVPTPQAAQNVENEGVYCCRGEGWEMTGLGECITGSPAGVVVPLTTDVSQLACGGGQDDNGESHCDRCGEGFWNVCTPDECQGLGTPQHACTYHPMTLSCTEEEEE